MYVTAQIFYNPNKTMTDEKRKRLICPFFSSCCSSKRKLRELKQAYDDSQNHSKSLERRLELIEDTINNKTTVINKITQSWSHNTMNATDFDASITIGDGHPFGDQSIDYEARLSQLISENEELEEKLLKIKNILRENLLEAFETGKHRDEPENDSERFLRNRRRSQSSRSRSGSRRMIKRNAFIPEPSDHMKK